MKLINRPQYTDKIRPSIGKGLIIVLTGQRRVGKSCILQQLIQETGSKQQNNIIYINKEKAEFDFIKSHKELTLYVNEHLNHTKENYLFIDEIQEIIEFEKTLRSLQADDECNIIVTGSNAKMLSSELSTVLSGRYIEFHIQSLNYKEFLEFHQLEDIDSSLMKYLTYGGLPQLYRIGLENQDLAQDYLHNIYNTIILKDVIAREQIRNVPFLENLISFISDSTGKIISASSISKYMKTQQIEVTTTVILNYLAYFCNAFIINKVPRYDIHGKRLLESSEKYYFEDLGLRNDLTGSNRIGDIEKLIENAIYLHLKSQGFAVFVGQFRQMEIDFVAKKNEQTIYVQATYLLASENTIEREFGNLQLIKDNYPKYVISLDPFHKVNDREGITQLHLREFLKRDF
ncbi:aTPase [Bacteroides intestinalis CAG:315]|jgi:predicted AAA+ superfamily ATPase|uniref:ATP-binding protein n=1 Tax=Bacteroides intestinalis TaxID=329854 RepID=A0A412YLP6_9BACE|nr:ATP-binding protein [Bacteroides intestinalis]MCD7938758.1 ATP-binding protein [Bacteroides intestinalis]RGV58346.1 ATP-binding protein [Bacteroides intestinalis]RHA63437.1 ATP-binding protein [Bacteroides intestinalis]CDD95925.1 aTPase [Bacteroides intestinalis CAG:315]